MSTSAREESARLSDLLRREHRALAEFLVALSDFDRRRVWVELGYTSLFWFLHRELGLSKGAAFYRKTGAELVQRFPETLEPLRDGRLCLSSVAELAKVITPENRAEVLPRFFTLSKGEAKEVVAELLPADAPPLRDSITIVHAFEAPPAFAVSTPGALPASSPIASSSRDASGAGPADALAVPPAASTTVLPRSRGFPENLPHANSRVPDEASASPAPPSRPAFEVEPLTADLRRLHITVSRRILDKLEAARDALSHSHPGAGRDEILEVGLDLILERQAKRRGLVRNPRKKADSKPSAEASTQTRGPTSTATSTSPATLPPSPSPSPRSRYVPAEVRRAVWKRDGSQCQWPLASGGVCGKTSEVEIDHIDGFALGGDTSVEACRLLCRFHQDVHARQLYGNDVMDLFTRPKGGGCSEPVAQWVA
jgi:hypothetical protein